MSELKKHLQAAKKEYQTIRYPGDLASEILNRSQQMPSRQSGTWMKVAGVLAAAAMIALVVGLWPANEQPAPADQIVQIDPEIFVADSDTEAEMELTEVSLSDLPALSMPSEEDGVDFAPESPGFSFSTPSFSLLSDESDDSSQPQSYQTITPTEENV